MCGILGAVTHTPVNQLLYDGLLLLQHRGQDAAGIVTSEGPVFHMYKGPGYVRDVFRTRNMRELMGNTGIGHCRYPTAGSASSELESQPFYVNSPFGITLAHNGNLTNSMALKKARGASFQARCQCDLHRGGSRAQTLPRRLRDRRDDRWLRPACLSRSFRYPPLDHRCQRVDGGHRVRGCQ